MNLIILPFNDNDRERDSIEGLGKGGWKKRAEEKASYRRIRDEKKRKKKGGKNSHRDDKSQVYGGYIILVATDTCLRTIRLYLKGKQAVQFKEIQVDYKTNCETGNCILQTLKKSEEDIQIYASNSIGSVEIFDINLS